MTVYKKQVALGLGREAESFVVSALEQEGWGVLERNWRGGFGELDIVCSRRDSLRFVEVKARKRFELEPIRKVQVERLMKAATAYIEHHGRSFDEVYFSVALVFCGRSPWSLVWYEDAFDYTWEDQCRFG